MPNLTIATSSASLGRGKTSGVATTMGFRQASPSARDMANTPGVQLDDDDMQQQTRTQKSYRSHAICQNHIPLFHRQQQFEPSPRDHQACGPWSLAPLTPASREQSCCHRHWQSKVHRLVRGKLWRCSRLEHPKYKRHVSSHVMC